MPFQNAYEDETRAASYARLGFPATYYLAFRDLPALLERHAPGRRALDFGCGAGRSTRFLKAAGYDAVGADVSPQMIRLARELDPAGTYRLVRDARYAALGAAAYDLVLSAFTFDNIPDAKRRAAILTGLRALLTPRGIIVLLDGTPELYRHEWASVTTAEFSDNRTARSGEIVRGRIRDADDTRPIEDILWSHEDYLALFRTARLRVVEVLRPLGRADEPFDWVNETRIAPWVIYVLQRPTSTSTSSSSSTTASR